MADASSQSFRRSFLPSSRDPAVVSEAADKPSRDTRPTRHTAGENSHRLRPDLLVQLCTVVLGEKMRWRRPFLRVPLLFIFQAEAREPVRLRGKILLHARLTQ